MDRGEDLFASRQRCKEIYRQASVALDVFKSLSSERRYAVRSSSNCEDLSGQSGAGWHSSVLGVRHADLPEACATVWASLWNEAGVQGRRSLGIPQGDAQMAILIQEVCEPEWSFICHTQDPDRQEIETQQSKSRNSKQEDSDEKAEAGVAIEMAHGLGEILTSASQAGQPYSLTVEKDHVKVLHYGTYLERFDLGEASELKVSFLESDAHHAWQSPEGLSQSVLQIATCAKALEDVLGEPQDIEGCCCDGQIFIVQTRPQLA
jgi:phosphoglucan,water dikinase